MLMFFADEAWSSHSRCMWFSWGSVPQHHPCSPWSSALGLPAEGMTGCWNSIPIHFLKAVSKTHRRMTLSNLHTSLKLRTPSGMFVSASDTPLMSLLNWMRYQMAPHVTLDHSHEDMGSIGVLFQNASFPKLSKFITLCSLKAG